MQPHRCAFPAVFTDILKAEWEDLKMREPRKEFKLL